MKARRLIIVVLAIGLMLGLVGIASAASIGCGQCHGAYINGTSGGYTEMPGVSALEDVKTPQPADICSGAGRGLHGVHMNYSSASYGRAWDSHKTPAGLAETRGSCSLCHNKHAHENGFVEFSGMSYTDPNSNLKVSSKVGVSGPGISADGLDITQMTGTATCTAACHKGTSAVNPAPWGNITSASVKLSCIGCHGDSAGVNMANYSAVNLSYGHGIHIANLSGAGNAVCHNCHPDNTGDLWSQGRKDNGTVKAYPHASDGTNVKASNVAALGRIGAGGSLKTFTFNYSAQTCSNTYCHGSNSPVWGSRAASACTFCHDKPPMAGSHSIHSQGYIGYANKSNATSYDFGCYRCHPQAQHTQGPASTSASAYVAFSNVSSPVSLGGTYTAGTSQGNDSKGYMWSNATCSNALYCHSNGRGGNAAVTPVWGGAAMTCTSCHGGAAAKASVTLGGSHPTHVGTTASSAYGYNCSQCHVRTVSSGSSAVSNRALHVNGVKDIYFTTFGGMTGFYTSGQACRNTYCHSDGNGGAPSVTPQWGVTVIACNSCHNYKAPTAISTGKHTAHTSNGNVGSFGCVQCHNKTVNSSDAIQYSLGKHVNGAKDVYFNAFNGYTGGYNGTAKTCRNVYCHSSGQAASTVDGTPVFRAAAAWNSATTYTCAACHGADTGTGTFTSRFGEPNYANRSTASRAFYNGHGVAGHVGAASDCSKCHYGTATVNVFSGFANITSGGRHLNGARDINFRPGITATYDPVRKQCTDVSCHGGAGSGTFRWGGAGGDCKTCHSNTGIATTSGRRSVEGDFSKVSHHVNTTWANYKTRTCAVCHAEANPDGSINATYHKSGKAVVLNAWNAAFTQSTGIVGVSRTFVRYTTGTGSSAGLKASDAADLNPVCLSCHNRANANSRPFQSSGDTRKPTVYSWENSTSIDARYSNTGTTLFSKYSPSTNNVVPQIVKAFSPHGNGVANQRGKAKYGPWADDSQAGQTTKVACFDCHNSHGSSVGSYAGNTMPLTSYTSAVGKYKGGLFKEYSSAAGFYMPKQAGVIGPNSNNYSASAALCFDCHLAADPARTNKNNRPMKNFTTFGLHSTIDGYYDAGRWQKADLWKGSFAYKTSNASATSNGNGSQKGGHFGASSNLVYTNGVPAVNGRCVVCHDPHGVAQNANRNYMVPSLRGTWMTSPYKEDRVASQSGVTDSNTYGSFWISKKGGFKPARMNPRFNYNNPPYVGGGYGKGAGGNWGQGGNGADGYFIDDNTFGTNVTYGGTYPSITDNTTTYKVTGVTAKQISETTDKFAGLCLGCHNSTSIKGLSYTNQTTTWHPHYAVAGWGTTTDNVFQPRHASEHNMSFEGSSHSIQSSMTCSGSTTYTAYVMPSGYRWSVTPGTSAVTARRTSVPPPVGVGQTGTSYVQNQYHAFSCSKCHTAHTSKLPRLMKTNCLDVGSGTSPKHNSGYSYPVCDNGASTNTGGMGYQMLQCHNIKRTNSQYGGGWNNKTGW